MEVVGLHKLDNTAKYDGTSWSEVNDFTRGVRSNDTIGMGGNSSAGLFFGHCGDPLTEEWNGTNWSETTIFQIQHQLVGVVENHLKSAIWVGYYSRNN